MLELFCLRLLKFCIVSAISHVLGSVLSSGKLFNYPSVQLAELLQRPGKLDRTCCQATTHCQSLISVETNFQSFVIIAIISSGNGNFSAEYHPPLQAFETLLARSSVLGGWSATNPPTPTFLSLYLRHLLILLTLSPCLGTNWTC